MQTALDFLKKHPEVAFATCEDNRPKIRVFQIMKMEGTVLYFATTPPVLKHYDLTNHTESNGFVGERFTK